MAQKLTPEEMGRVREALAAGVDPERIKQIILQRQQATEPVEPKQPEVSTDTPGFFTEDVVPVSRETPILTSGKLGNIVAQQATETVTPEPIQTDVLPSITGGLISKIPGSDIPEKFISEPITEFAESSQAAAEEFTTPATGEEGVKEFAQNIASNIIPSLGKQGAGIIETVANPIDSAGGIFSLATGIIENITQPILNTISGDDTVTANQQMVKDIATELNEKYGTLEKASKALQENPIVLIEILTNSILRGRRSKRANLTTEEKAEIKRIQDKVDKGDNITDDEQATLDNSLTKRQQTKVTNLRADALGKIDQFFNPSKDVMKRATQKISKEVLDKQLSGNRKEVLSLAKEQRKIFGKMVGELKDAGVQGQISVEELMDTVSDFAFRAKLIDSKGNVLPGQESKLKFLDETTDLIFKYSKGEDFIDANLISDLKDQWGKVFNGTDRELSNFQNDLQAKAATNLIKQFAKENPLLAEINKEASFYINLDNVLTDTIKRKTGTGEGGGLETTRGRIFGGLGSSSGVIIGSALAGPVGGIIGTVLGASGGLLLDQLMKSPKWKIVSAQKKARLAEAIVNGDAGKAEKLMNAMILEQGLNIDLTTSEEQVKQDEESEAERQRILKMLQSR